MTAKIQGKATGEIDVKRFYLPGVQVTDKCECGKVCTTDLSDEYISYPHMNDNESVNMCCECGADWRVAVRLVVKLEVVK